MRNVNTPENTTSEKKMRAAGKPQQSGAEPNSSAAA